MKIIVATSETQGQRPGDFNFVPNGEIVMVSDCEYLHTECDCARSMAGIKSDKEATTMKVIESNIALEEYHRLIGEANQRYGELGVDDAICSERADALIDLVMQIPAGTVIERNGEEVYLRQISA